MNNLLSWCKKIDWRAFFWMFFYFFLFFLLVRASFSYLDPDFGWHLRVGEEIAKTGLVPSTNHYNYTYTGDWVDHEWLSNFLLFKVYNAYGYSALVYGFAALIILVLVILNIWFRRRRPDIPFGIIAGLQFFGVAASLPHFGVRIQEFGLLFLLLLLIIIDGYERRLRWRALLLLPPFFYIWSCLHGSFLIGFFLLAFWLSLKVAEKILACLFARFWPKRRLDFLRLLKTRHLFIFSGAALLSFVATLFTPYKLNLYSFLGGYRNNFYMSHIQEWLSQFSFPLQYRQLAYLALAVLMFLFYIYYWRRGNKMSRSDGQEAPLGYQKIPPGGQESSSGYQGALIADPALRPPDLWSLALAVLFIFLSFKSRRHFPLMFIATFAFLAETGRGLLEELKLGPLFGWLSALSNRPKKINNEQYQNQSGQAEQGGQNEHDEKKQYQETTEQTERTEQKKRRLNRWLKIYLLFCLFLVGLFQWTLVRPINDPFRSFCDEYPCAAVDFLKSRSTAAEETGRLFNDYSWGGYLIGVWPEKQLFIDGRLPQVEFAGQTFLEEYYEFFKRPNEVLSADGFQISASGAQAGGDDQANDGSKKVSFSRIKNKLEQYQITSVLLPTKDEQLEFKNWEKKFFMISDEELRTRNYLREYLDAAGEFQEPEWNLIYADETAVIYERKE